MIAKKYITNCSVVGAPSAMVTTPASLFSVGDSTSLTCTIILVNNLVTSTSLEVNWTLPDNSARIAGTSSDATLTGNGTSYESVLTIPTLSLSLAGIYICSAIVTSTLPLTTNSEVVMNSSVVTVQSKENNNFFAHIHSLYVFMFQLKLLH